VTSLCSPVRSRTYRWSDKPIPSERKGGWSPGLRNSGGGMIWSRRILGWGFLSSEDCAATGATHTDNSNERTRRRRVHMKPSSFADTIAPIIIAPILFYTAEQGKGEENDWSWRVGVHPSSTREGTTLKPNISFATQTGHLELLRTGPPTTPDVPTYPTSEVVLALARAVRCFQ
jgi:hypothetical protein